MGLNILHQPLPTFSYQTAKDTEEILKGVHTLDFLCRLSGDLTVTGANGDGTLLSEAEFRLIKSMRLVWDGVDLIEPISGRELAELSRRLFAQSFTNTTVDEVATAETDSFDVFFAFPIRRRYLVNPIEVHLPPLPVSQSLRIEVEWETGKTNSSSDAGTAAFSTDSSDTLTLANVELNVVQVFAHDAPKPIFMPTITSYDSEQFTAANPRLEMSMKSTRPMDALLISVREGAAQDYADLINEVTLLSGSTRWFNSVPYPILHEWEQTQYPAVGDSPVGNLWMPFADGGKLGNALAPASLSNPRFEFDVNAPNTNPGFIRLVQMELMKVPGATTGPGGGGR